MDDIMEIEINELDNDPSSRANEVRIAAVGVGGGGINTINHLSIHKEHESIQLIAMNTDVQALRSISAHHKLVLGEKTTRGWGAGMNPEKGRKSAEESYEAIKEAIKDFHIIFISTGLGGGTGTGASPIVARAAREVGANTIAVVTKPFDKEGPKRTQVAEDGIKALKSEVDCIIVVPNERLLSHSKNLSLDDAFKIVDDVSARAVNSVSRIILGDSKNGINADYADLLTVMEFKGLALIGMGDKSGDDSALEALREAIESPLLGDISIKGAKGGIVVFEMHKDYPLHLINNAMEVMSNQVAPDAFIKFGHLRNNELEVDRVKIMLIVTGFENTLITDETIQPQAAPAEQKQNQGSTITLSRRVVGGNRENIPNMRNLDEPTYKRNARD